MAGSSLSESSDSFVEHDGEKKSNVPSSDSSFVNVDPVHKDFQVDVNESNETDVTSVDQTVIRTVDPSIHSIPIVDNNCDKFLCGLSLKQFNSLRTDSWLQWTNLLA